jgi:MoaA/NifB/PqqE/SkfB family radical SAM enzyme
MKDNNNSILALQHSGGGSSNFIFKDNDIKLKSLWIEIPDYCHLHCDYCYASTDNKPKQKEEYLIYKDYEKLLIDFSALGGKYIGIPGKGEPFHQQNWELTKKIIALCDNLKLELAIFTTGDAIFFKPKDKIDAIPNHDKMNVIKDKNIVLLIKCNSKIPEIQNKLVNDRHNKYSQLRDRAIDILINEYHLNDSHKLGIVTSVMRDNENEIVDLYKWAQEKNIIFDCDTILERGRGKEFTLSGKVPPKIDLESVFKRLKKVGAITNCQGGTYVGSTCDRILHHLYISVEGEIFPCIGCLREDIKENFQLGNIKDLSLSEVWNNKLRQRLANNYKQIFLGTCKKCQNLEDESCYSCLGRCTSKIEDGCFIQTTGCIHHKPITTTWLATVIDYIRKILSFKETRNILNNEGLERLWRPNKNIAFSLLQLSKEERERSIKELISLSDPQNHPYYKPYSLITDSRVDDFSKKKHFNFKEISFPMNKVWDFSCDPNKIFDGIDLSNEEKDKVINEISHSFLSNIFLASFKILFEKYDDSDELIRYCNFMLYDSINKKYFYRSIVKESSSDESGIMSLIISRWYEDLGPRNFWKEFCYDLSDSFSDEVYGEYELKLSNKNKENERSLTRRTINLTEILELTVITDKVNNFVAYTSAENKDFIEKFNIVRDIINSNIFTELKGKNDVVSHLTTLYESINEKAFYQINDAENILVLNRLSDVIENLEDKNFISKKLKEEFLKSRESGNGTKFFNYFIYLGIMQKVFDINYYYLMHSTNFSTINTEKQSFVADSDFRGVIKPSGVLLCTNKQINVHFRSELKLFISGICAPFDEFYFTQLYGKIQANRQFHEKIEAHRHTLLNLINGVEPFRSDLPDDKPYLKHGVNYAFIVAEDICSKKEDRDRIGKKLPNTPDKLLFDLCVFFKANISSTMKLKYSIDKSSLELSPLKRIDFITILYNLLHNAEKSDSYNESFNNKYEYLVSSYSISDYYEINIVNPAIMSNKVLNFLNDTDINFHTFPYDKEIKTSGGLSIIKRLIFENEKYGWSIEAKGNESNKETIITLKIK